MPPSVSAIHWGTGFENILRIPYPLDNLVPRRRPRPGSTRQQLGDGSYASWIEGRDYELDAELRWTPRGDISDPVGTGWSGPVGVEEFLAWAAGDQRTFRFVPDATVPDFYVDSCSLVAPFEDPRPEPEEDGTFRVPITIANPTMPFGQALRGIMFDYAPGMSLIDPVAATFSRANAATRRGLPGNLAAAIGASDAANVLRDRHYEGSLRTTLLEAARTQLVADPENFGLWTAVNAPTVASGQVDPFGGTAAYLITDDSATLTEFIEQIVTFTGDATKAQVGFVKASTAAFTDFDIFGAVTRVRIRITWTGGVASAAVNAGSGTARAIAWGGGWYLIEWTAGGVIATDTNKYRFFPAGDDSAQTGATYFFGANAWNATFPSSYQGPSLTSRSNDSPLVRPWLYKDQPIFALVKLVERGGVLLGINGMRALAMGSSNNRIAWNITGTGGWSFFHDDGALFAGSNPATTFAIGDLTELLGLVLPDGDVRGIAAKNGGADVAGSDSALNPGFFAAFDDARIAINGTPGGGSIGFGAYAAVKVGPLIFGGVTRDTIAKARAA